MAEQGYTIGPVLADRMIATIKRVDSMAYGSGRGPREARFEEWPPRRGGGGSARLFEFTGAWSKNTIKNVRMINGDGTEITPPFLFDVKNYFATLSGDCSVRKGAAMNIGGTWVMIAVECV